MSNFSDMAYDNYLMHYRTKGSKNGFTKDPDYTPVGEKAVAKKVLRDKIDKLAIENWKKRNELGARYRQAARGDYAGMPSSIAAIENQKREKANKELLKEASDRYDKLSVDIHKFRNQASRGDYAGMPSSAREAKENAPLERAKRYYANQRKIEIARLSDKASRGDLAGMPSSAREAKERNAEIKKLRSQANRGDLAGMPSSALEAKERANRASEISRLRTQRLIGDYAGMPSSALEAKENAKIQKRDRMKSKAEAKRKSEYMKSKAEAKRKKESEINRLSKQKTRGDYAGMPSSALKAKEKTERASEINRLSKQANKGDYAGMPSSAKAAIENAERAKRAKEISERAKLERFKAEARNKNLMWEAWRRKWKNQRGY